MVILVVVGLCLSVLALCKSSWLDIHPLLSLLFSEFLQRGAVSEVNVSADVQEEVEKDLKDPSRYAFSAAQVRNNIHSTSVVWMPSINFTLKDSDLSYSLQW